MDQRLVADIGFLREPIVIVEIHFHSGKVHRRPSTLDLELERDSLIRRDAQHQPIGPQSIDWRAVERRVGCLLETDRDLRIPLRQVLAGTDVEGHAGPAPVGDLELHGDIGLDVRSRRHVGFLAIRPDLLASTVPAPYWPRTARAGLTAGIAANTSAFFVRIEAASKPVGGSMATIESNVNTWFGTMSRSAPVPS